MSVAAAADGLSSATTVLTGLQDELGGCSGSTWWAGEAATAASREHAGLTERLRRLVAQAAAVRTALDETGESVLALHREIGSTADFAASWQFVIGDDGSVRDNAPTPPAPTSPEQSVAADREHAQRVRAQSEIVDRIEQVLRTATDVDADLTAVLEAAVADEIDDGAGSGLAGAQAAGTAWGELSAQGPPPSADPADNSAWWNTLGDAQQAAVLAQHPDWIGDLDGVPAGVRSQANVARLPAIAADLQARADALRDQLAGHPGRYATTQLQDQLAEVVAKQESLTAITHVMGRGGRQLLLVDTSGDRAMAAIAIGDVDTADHVSVFTPGFNSTVNGNLEGYDRDTELLRQRTRDQLDRFGGGGSVAAVTWMGYEPPGGDVGTDISSLDPDNLAGAYPVADDDVARSGAASLSSFCNGIDASRDVDPHLTALGHSYGSLTTGLALQNGTGVDDAVLFGSPGLGTDDVADLGLRPGHVYLEEAHEDHVADLGAFGRDPSTLAGVTSLATDARTLPDGTQGAASSGHSEYADQGQAGDEGYRRTTATYNMATVVAGLPGRAVEGLDVDRGDEVRAAVQREQDALSGINLGLGDPARFVTPYVDPLLDAHLRGAHELWDLQERTLDHGLDRADGVRAGLDAAQDWVRDRATDVGKGLGEAIDDARNTVTELGRGGLNLAAHPPWSR